MKLNWDWFLSFGGILLKAVLILALGHLAVRLIIRIIKDCLKKSEFDYSLQSFIIKTINIISHTIVIISAISALGISTTGLLASLSAVAVGIGLALKDSLSNVAGGILLLISPRFHTGDIVEIDGEVGTVVKIDLMHTLIRAYDNRDVVIPNSLVMNSRIINYSREHKRRVDMVFPIAYENDLEVAKKAIYDTAMSHPLVLKEEPIFTRVGSYSSSSVDITARVWCKTENYWDVYHDLLEQVRTEFQKRGINIPFNQLDVHISNNE